MIASYRSLRHLRDILKRETRGVSFYVLMGGRLRLEGVMAGQGEKAHEGNRHRRSGVHWFSFG